MNRQSKIYFVEIPGTRQFFALMITLFILIISPFVINSSECNDNKTEIRLTYKFDKKNNILELSWNRTGNGKYYVFKKDNDSDDYSLITPDGIADDHYTLPLNENINCRFKISLKDELAKMPDDVFIFTLFNRKKLNYDFKYLKNTRGIESDSVIVMLDDSRVEDLYKYAMNKNKNADKKIAVVNERGDVSGGKSSGEDKKHDTAENNNRRVINLDELNNANYTYIINKR